MWGKIVWDPEVVHQPISPNLFHFQMGNRKIQKNCWWQTWGGIKLTQPKNSPAEQKGAFPALKRQNSDKVYKIERQEHIFGIIFSPSTGGLDPGKCLKSLFCQFVLGGRFFALFLLYTRAAAAAAPPRISSSIEYSQVGYWKFSLVHFFWLYPKLASIFCLSFCLSFQYFFSFLAKKKPFCTTVLDFFSLSFLIFSL